KIAIKDNALQFDFHKIILPLTHFHYDRFDTPNDEENGKWSVNFSTNPQGDIDKATMSLDEGEVTFVRRPPKLDEAAAQLIAGNYETVTGAKFQIMFQPDSGIFIETHGTPHQKRMPYKPLKSHRPEFSALQ